MTFLFVFDGIQCLSFDGRWVIVLVFLPMLLVFWLFVVLVKQIISKKQYSPQHHTKRIMKMWPRMSMRPIERHKEKRTMACYAFNMPAMYVDVVLVVEQMFPIKERHDTIRNDVVHSFTFTPLLLNLKNTEHQFSLILTNFCTIPRSSFWGVNWRRRGWNRFSGTWSSSSRSYTESGLALVADMKVHSYGW